MRIDLLEAFGLDPKIINILKSKYGESSCPSRSAPSRNIRSSTAATSSFPPSHLPDKPTTEALAHHLSHALNLPSAGAIAEMNTLEESVSRDMLLTFLSSGVAVHNADPSWEERDIVERYTRKGEIRVLCTPPWPWGSISP